MTNQNKCMDCGGEKKKLAKRCLKCANINHLKTSRMANCKTPDRKLCPECRDVYQPRIKTQHFCSERCKETNSNKQSNGLWASKCVNPCLAMENMK